ncbi:DUF2953 domain-containing protein [Oceanobacillus chungangensis]|uniref:DUF2953 domain-containing protein n=1 Tax=Oceanobacillus chungangensis TaxID=1229152 RepID=A0A3D8Q296_9BACI|nr:DUF2953 domain-containing protein [Oceanobacillus chungangensis]RDW21549.1 hypothetical protein CWR45_01355 [Oceanobacillus chungangensis]
MLVSLIILGILFLLFMLLFFSRVYFHLHYSLKNKQQQLFLTITIYKIPLYRKNLDISDISPDPISVDFTTFPDEVKRLKANVKDAKEKIDYILNTIRIHQLRWSTVGGSGDAFLTGIASGAVWSIKGIIIGYIYEMGEIVCRPDIEVLPTFQSKEFTTTIECIISLPLGQARHTLLRKKRGNASFFTSNSE